MAVGPVGSCESSSALSRAAASAVQSEPRIQASSHSRPRSADGLEEGLEAVLGGLDVGDVLGDRPDVADPGVAQAGEVVDGGAHGGLVVDPHAGPVGHRRADGDQGQPEPVDELDLLAGSSGCSSVMTPSTRFHSMFWDRGRRWS